MWAVDEILPPLPVVPPEDAFPTDAPPLIQAAMAV
jgi:hypothetical protein